MSLYFTQFIRTVMSAHYDKPSVERLGKIAGQGMVGAEI